LAKRHVGEGAESSCQEHTLEFGLEQRLALLEGKQFSDLRGVTVDEIGTCAQGLRPRLAVFAPRDERPGRSGDRTLEASDGALPVLLTVLAGR
jgi:hypothetical protein